MDHQIKAFKPDEINCIVGEYGCIGAGSFGKVRIGFIKAYGAVAIKCIEYSGRYTAKNKLIKTIEDEILHLDKARNHNNVVGIYGTVLWTGSIGLVMEYLPSGNLLEIILDKEVEIGVLLRLRMAAEIASGLAFIHNIETKRIIHGDLKPENILLTDDLHCKIADFGSSIISSYTGCESIQAPYGRKENNFTFLFAAPELLKDNGLKLTPAIDTYSFSIILYFILKRERPIYNQDLLFIYCKSIKDRERPNLEFVPDLRSKLSEMMKTVIDLLVQLMEQCWKQDPLERPPMLNVSRKLKDLLQKFPKHDLQYEVARATENVETFNPSSSEYPCASIDKFAPPNFDQAFDYVQDSRAMSSNADTLSQSNVSISSMASMSIVDRNPHSSFVQTHNVSATEKFISSLATNSSSESPYKTYTREKSGFIHSENRSTKPKKAISFNESLRKNNESSTVAINLTHLRVSENNPNSGNSEDEFHDATAQTSLKQLDTYQAHCVSSSTSTSVSTSSRYIAPHLRSKIISIDENKISTKRHELIKIESGKEKFPDFFGSNVDAQHEEQPRTSSRRVDVNRPRCYSTNRLSQTYPSPSRSKLSDCDGELLMMRQNNFIRYKIRSKTETFLKSLNTEHKSGAIVNHFNEVYALGGWRSKTVEKIPLLNPLSDQTWKTVCQTRETRFMSAFASHRDHIYAVGGSQDKTSKSSGEKYDLSSDKWMGIKAMNEQREGHVLVSLQDGLYVLGGKNSNSVEVYNPARDEWSYVAPMANRRNRLAAVALRGKIFAIGGDFNWKSLKTVECYDPAIDRWTSVKDLKSARFDHCACVVNDRIFVVGGKSDLVEVYDPFAKEWSCDGSDELRNVDSILTL